MSADVAVVGGGAIGAAVALELARRGAPVLLLERGPELASGCSAGNAGLICPSHSFPLATPAALRQGLRWMLRPASPFYVRPTPRLVPWLARFAAASTARRAHRSMETIRALSLASLELHASLAAEGLETGFERRGVLNVYETAPGFDAGRAEAELHAAAGIRSEVLDEPSARNREPGLAEGIQGAILYPDEAHSDPLRFVRAVGAAAEAAGAEVRTRTEVLGLRRNGDAWTLETTAGDLAAGTVVLAAGAWTPLLARQLGAHVPVEGGKGYHVELERRDGDPRLPLFGQESRVIATPLGGRIRLAGTLELTGLDLGVNRARVRAVLGSGVRMLPSLAGRRVEGVWRGLRPCAPDGLPIVGPLPGHEGVVLATGHAMMGLTLAPITGRLVAELVTGEPPSADPAPLRPDRFRPLVRGRR